MAVARVVYRTIPLIGSDEFCKLNDTFLIHFAIKNVFKHAVLVYFDSNTILLCFEYSFVNKNRAKFLYLRVLLYLSILNPRIHRRLCAEVGECCVDEWVRL